jgi:hypothetical protein
MLFSPFPGHETHRYREHTFAATPLHEAEAIRAAAIGFWQKVRKLWRFQLKISKFGDIFLPNPSKRQKKKHRDLKSFL